MGVFRRLFKSKEDALQNQAARLVPAADIYAISTFVPLRDKLPFLQNVDAERWDFLVTVAGVFMAATRLNGLRLGDALETSLMQTVCESLDEWNPNGLHGFDDCKNMFERTYDSLTAAGHEERFIASDAVGTWIVWNIFERAPETKDERTLVRSVGAMVTHTFFDWWKK